MCSMPLETAIATLPIFPYGASIWGSACLGTLAFIVLLFCLETLESKSRSLALWSVVKWLPLVGLTGTATVVHIPFLIVLALAVLYGVWVYHRLHPERRGAE